MANIRLWIEGARLRTLPASISPILAGSAVAWFCARPGPPSGSRILSAGFLLILCLVVGIGFQVGCNYANDYSDGIRGTDEVRVGPVRLVGSGLVAPALVKRVAFFCFAIACGAGLLVVGLSTGFFTTAAKLQALSNGGWVTPAVLILVGVACILAAWFYTGGQHPYGYAGLGEVFVFVFFGLIATVGTAFVQSPRFVEDLEIRVGCPVYIRDMPWGPAILMGVAMGFFATAILVANNLRDLVTDSQAGKRTLGVVLGESKSRILYAVLVVAAFATIIVFAITVSWPVLFALHGAILLVRPTWNVLKGASGVDLVPVLKWTGIGQLLTAVLVVLGLGLGYG
ncbi:MAG: 1,4-dihydroxy-2-naphthoate octaprenyltransferase [Propionibacteriaceae bacterium]|nr:1,4-dihydroxy-2-naphthoate octaprenyltransferase [Propionibacteriaceae bacterium]